MFSEKNQYREIACDLYSDPLYGTATQTKPSAYGYEDDTLMQTVPDIRNPSTVLLPQTHDVNLWDVDIQRNRMHPSHI